MVQCKTLCLLYWEGDLAGTEGAAELGIDNGELYMRQRHHRKAQLAPVAVRGEIVQEKLPLPFVRYRRLYGTFFAFSETEQGKLYLCACAEGPLRNLLRLCTMPGQPRYARGSLRAAPLPSPYVPDIIAKDSLAHADDPLRNVELRPKLCHRCNLAVPSLRWCHEMYGERFEQQYGWYVKQTYLRLGITPNWFNFLPDVCPIEYQEQFRELKQAQDAYWKEEKRLKALASGPARADISPHEITYWRNVRKSEAKPMIALRKQAAQSAAAFHNSIESITRQEFGFRRVGEGWVSETLLYQIVCRLVHPERVLRHFRPDWLEGLELDLYIPDRRLAIEYQGQQHFHPIEAWGGIGGLEGLRRRDAKKAKACQQQGVHLITFDYTEPLTEDHVRQVLAASLKSGHNEE